MAESLHIDLAHAFEMKMKKNEEKYPEKIFASDVSEAERWRHYYRIKAKYRGGHPLAEEGVRSKEKISMGVAKSPEKIRKRDGRVVEFDPTKITTAILKAAAATEEFS